MRVFTALALPEEIQKAIGWWQKQWSEKFPQLKPVVPGNCHITLHFFGELTDAALTRQKEILAGLTFPPLLTTITGPSFFPRSGPARIVYLDLGDPNREIRLIVERYQTLLRAAGIAVDSRPFVPHITVARPKNFQLPREEFKRASAGRWSSFVLDTLVLYQSVLGPAGPQYIPHHLKKALT